MAKDLQNMERQDHLNLISSAMNLPFRLLQGDLRSRWQIAVQLALLHHCALLKEVVEEIRPTYMWLMLEMICDHLRNKLIKKRELVTKD